MNLILYYIDRIVNVFISIRLQYMDIPWYTCMSTCLFLCSIDTYADILCMFVKIHSVLLGDLAQNALYYRIFLLLEYINCCLICTYTSNLLVVTDMLDEGLDPIQLSSDQNPCYCCIQGIILPSYRGYMKPL